MFPKSKKTKARAEQYHLANEQKMRGEYIKALCDRFWSFSSVVIDEIKALPEWERAYNHKMLAPIHDFLMQMEAARLDRAVFLRSLRDGDLTEATKSYKSFGNTRVLIDGSRHYPQGAIRLFDQLVLSFPLSGWLLLDLCSEELAKLCDRAVDTTPDRQASKEAFNQACAIVSAWGEVNGLEYSPSWKEAVARYIDSPTWRSFHCAAPSEPGESRTWAAAALHDRNNTRAKMILAYIDSNHAARDEVGPYLAGKLAIMIQELKAELPQPV